MSKVKARVRVTDEGTALVIDGVIGDELGGVTAESVRESLEAMTGERITVHINSPGGAVFEGLSIHNALLEHPARIEVVIDGLAASIASVIAMAGDRIIMPEAAMLMIHDPWTLSLGNADQLRSDAAMLDKVRDTIVTAYRNRTGLDRDTIIGLMNAETWYTAQEAVDAGFADEIRATDASQALARLDLSILNIPPGVMAALGVFAGRQLASLLNGAIDTIDSDESDDRSRADVIGEMASAANISEGTVNEILNAEIDCPPLARLEGFAQVEGLPSTSEQRSAAESDGCEYGEDGQALSCPAINRNRGKQMNPKANEIRRSVKAAKLGAAFAEELIESGVTLNEARERIINAWADKDGPETRNVHRVMPTGYDDPKFRGNAMSEALYCRLRGKAPSEAARPYYHSRIADLARECLEFRGEPTRMLSDARIIENSLLTTSDFPELLTGTGERILRDAYEGAPAGVRNVARQATAQDFRAKTVLKLGEAPDLKKVKEHGEIERGATGEEKETYSLETYARIFGLTRKALVNDDLNAFADMAQRIGQAAAEFEAQHLVDLLTSNPTMDDGNALFHTSHSNLASSGSDVVLTALSEARRAMRRQKGVDGRHIINAEPQFILVPAAQETDAEKLVSEIQSATVSDVNPFSGRLTVVTDPRLDDDSATAWYVFADPTRVPVLEYAYLQDEQGPQITMREGFEIEGIEWKVRLDFGAGAIDWRGAYKDPGA